MTDLRGRPVRPGNMSARAQARERTWQEFLPQARAAGHELQVERLGSVLAPSDRVVASCTCGRYRSTPGILAVARNQWRCHARGTMYGHHAEPMPERAAS